MKYIISSILLLLGPFLHAHEGMWIPALLNSLNAGHLEANGLRLSPEEIYSINQSSLKDAIVHFGGGCTAEVISDKGLILTNYHCGYSQIQTHSSVDNDYLTNGFWADGQGTEIPNDGLSATFISSIEDVTDIILNGVTSEMTENERNKIIFDNSTDLESERSGDGIKAAVRSFFYGNEFYLINTKTYKDVRLVGAPPSSIGKFGGDTDNWVWPRHTGDFALFRIYAGADNEPAAYNKVNKPYRAKRHLRISLDGAEDGDFVMVYGFPGRTQQYLISDAVDHVISRSNPLKIEMRETSLSIIDKAMAADDRTRIQYASKQARISNAYKKWIGQNFGLERFNALEKKQEFEKEFGEWLKSDANAMSRYGSLIVDLKKAQDDAERYQMARELFIEYVYYGPEFYRLASRFNNLKNNYSDLSDSGELESTIASLKKAVSK
ncbi:MAG: serine protease, partial [Flavobacteriales bacterium]|nr:serine protease [Flavobacteriales bacterium]